MKLNKIRKKLTQAQWGTYFATLEHLNSSRESLLNIDLRPFRGDDQVRVAIQEARAATNAALLLVQTRVNGS